LWRLDFVGFSGEIWLRWFGNCDYLGFCYITGIVKNCANVYITDGTEHLTIYTTWLSFQGVIPPACQVPMCLEFCGYYYNHCNYYYTQQQCCVRWFWSLCYEIIITVTLITIKWYLLLSDRDAIYPQPVKMPSVTWHLQ